MKKSQQPDRPSLERMAGIFLPETTKEGDTEPLQRKRTRSEKKLKPQQENASNASHLIWGTTLNTTGFNSAVLKKKRPLVQPKRVGSTKKPKLQDQQEDVTANSQTDKESGKAGKSVTWGTTTTILPVTPKEDNDTMTHLPKKQTQKLDAKPEQQERHEQIKKIIKSWLWLLIQTKQGQASTEPETILNYCRQQFWWKLAMHLTDSTEQYIDILQYVLENGKLSEGEQQVLEVFTKDVCAHHLLIATRVWIEYKVRSE